MVGVATVELVGFNSRLVILNISKPYCNYLVEMNPNYFSNLSPMGHEFITLTWYQKKFDSLAILFIFDHIFLINRIFHLICLIFNQGFVGQIPQILPTSIALPRFINGRFTESPTLSTTQIISILYQCSSRLTVASAS